MPEPIGPAPSPFAFLNGWKTYLCVGVAAVLVGLEAFGYIPPGTADKLIALFGLGAVAGLRKAIANKE